MNTKPILFSASMVRALLAGTKTQTRRAMNPQPQPWGGHGGLQLPGYCSSTEASFKTGAPIFKPRFGQPGDRLWVRETWARAKVAGTEMVVYREGDNRTDYGGPWKPGIHMFRRDSRILLEVTEVRVERLQDISEADAQAEGIAYSERFRGYCIGEAEHFNSHDPRQSYFSLWETINGPGSVEANPWVWAVSFKRVEAGRG